MNELEFLRREEELGHMLNDEQTHAIAVLSNHLDNIVKILRVDNYDEVTAELVRSYCMCAGLLERTYEPDISNLGIIEGITGVKFYE